MGFHEDSEDAEEVEEDEFGVAEGEELGVRVVGGEGVVEGAGGAVVGEEGLKAGAGFFAEGLEAGNFLIEEGVLVGGVGVVGDRGTEDWVFLKFVEVSRGEEVKRECTLRKILR